MRSPGCRRPSLTAAPRGRMFFTRMGPGPWTEESRVTTVKPRPSGPAEREGGEMTEAQLYVSALIEFFLRLIPPSCHFSPSSLPSLPLSPSSSGVPLSSLCCSSIFLQIKHCLGFPLGREGGGGLDGSSFAPPGKRELSFARIRQTLPLISRVSRPNGG